MEPHEQATDASEPGVPGQAPQTTTPPTPPTWAPFASQVTPATPSQAGPEPVAPPVVKKSGPVRTSTAVIIAALYLFILVAFVSLALVGINTPAFRDKFINSKGRGISARNVSKGPVRDSKTLVFASSRYPFSSATTTDSYNFRFYTKAGDDPYSPTESLAVVYKLNPDVGYQQIAAADVADFKVGRLGRELVYTGTKSVAAQNYRVLIGIIKCVSESDYGPCARVVFIKYYTNALGTATIEQYTRVFVSDTLANATTEAHTYLKENMDSVLEELLNTDLLAQATR